MECHCGRGPFDLNKVHAFMGIPGIAEPCFDGAVVCQNEESFAIGIKSAGSIHPAGEGSVVRKGLPTSRLGKLREHPVRFEEENHHGLRQTNVDLTGIKSNSVQDLTIGHLLAIFA
jgi:hypothetical protein